MLELKVRALNVHVPNVLFSGARTWSRKPSIEPIDLKSFLSGHWSYAGGKELSTILTCFGYSDVDIKI